MEKMWVARVKEGSLQKTLKHLIDLQKLDSELSQRESLRGDLPHQVSRLKKELEEAESLLKDREAKLTLYQKERGITEMDIKTLEGKKTKYQNQLFEVKNNREYDAVTYEIEKVKSDIETKESRILELMGLEEETSRFIGTEKIEIQKLSNQLDTKSIELKKRLAETEKDEARLKDQRDKILRKLEPRIISTYERIRSAKNGFAVVPVIRNACGGCFKALPLQRIMEIRHMARLFLCDVCGRILVWDEEVSEHTE